MRKSFKNNQLLSNRAGGPCRKAAWVTLAAAAVQVLPASSALAISGTWSQNVPFSIWSNSGNWVSGNIADGNGSTADFSTLNLTADNTVVLDSARTIGNLVFGDTTPSHNWSLSTTGPFLNMAVASGTPTITVNNQTASMNIQFSGTQGLAKNGAGKLILNGANTYTGGTFVNAGTLAIGPTGKVLPPGSALTVNSGATFDYGNGNTINNSGGAIGTMTLNNGTYRLSGGAGDFYLNQLVVGATGGTLDFTGSTNYWTHFTGAGAGITVNADSTWTGAGTSRFHNETGALLPIAVNNAKTVTSSLHFANGLGGFGYRLAGNSSLGTLYLKNPTATNTADFRVEWNTLRVDDMAALGTGVITLAGTLSAAPNAETTAYLRYSGTTASSSKALTLDSAGGTIYVSAPGTTLTLNGVINETGGTGRGLGVYGDGGASVLTLTAANTYTGPTGVAFGGILSIPTIANGGVASPLGASSNAPANLRLGSTFTGGDGTLRYTGPTASTDRGVTLANTGIKTTIDVFTAGTTLTMSGQIVGIGGLTKAGPGTLVLTNATNTYANGTTVDSGTLAVGASGAVLPAGKNVTVNSGATFNYGNGATVNNSGSAIGTLTLNSSTYRQSGGSGDFYLNRLVIGNTGGTINLTGTSNFWTHFIGAGAGITVNTDSAWTGAGSSNFRNDTGALLPITINNNKTVTSSVTFANGSGGFGFRLLGGYFNALYLKNPTSTNTADFRVEDNTLRVEDMAALGSGAITLAGAFSNPGDLETTAYLQYSGPTASSSKALTLDSAGGVIWVSEINSTLTLNGVISEAGGTGRGLVVDGASGVPSTLILTAANTYTGPTAIGFGGILSIPTIANGGLASPLGKSSNAPANLVLGSTFDVGDGTLRYTGPTASTDRGATFKTASYKSVIDVATAAATLTMSGQLVGPGGLTKAGPGTLVLTNPANTYANGTTVDAGTLAVGAIGAALPANKNVTVNSGATLNYGNGVGVDNTSAPIGTLTLNSGTYRVSGGAGDFYMNQLVIGNTGGTLDFSGTSQFYSHFVGSGAGITVNANSTWTGAGESRFRNDTTALLPITINNNATVTSGVVFGVGDNGFGFRLLGGGTLVLNPTGGNTGAFRVENGQLQASAMTAFGTGSLTLAGTFLPGSADTTAVLYYNGPTATSAKAIALDANGGVIANGTAGTSLTLSGVISETGGTGRALTVLTPDTNSPLVLTANNTYTGPTTVSGGSVLSIPTIANGGVASPIGASSNAPANLRLAGGVYSGDGVLRYTGTTASTDRGVTLGSSTYKSTIDVTNAAATLAFSGAVVGNGSLWKAGPGTLRLTGANTYFSTTTVLAGTISANTFAYTTVLNASNNGLDILGGKFVFDYTGNVNPVSTIKSILTAGYNLPSKFATGQIRATGLAANRTLGYGDSGTAVTVMLTLPGDADLNGQVNFNDFLVLQNNFGASNTTFAQGNFDYNAATNFNDFLILQNFFGQSISGAAVVVTSAQVAAMTAFASTVPEPTTLAMLAMAAGLAGRRRRWN